MTTALIFKVIEDSPLASVTSRLDKVFCRQRTIFSVTGACFTRPKRRSHHDRGVSPWNASDVFSPHYPGEKTTNHRPLWICAWKKPWAGKSYGNRCVLFFEKLRFKMFSFRTKTKNRRFQIPRFFKERFRKAPFSWRISVDGRPNCRNKAVFSNFSGEVWTGLKQN